MNNYDEAISILTHRIFNLHKQQRT